MALAFIMKNKYLATLVGSLFVIIISLLVYQFVFRDSGDIRLPMVEGCSLHLEPCSSPLPMGGRMIFEINPKQPDPTQVLYLSARFQQIEPQAVRVRFKGETMNMGYLEHVKYELPRKDTTDETILFSGIGGLSVCISGLMEWIALVNIQVGDTIYEVPFRFETTYVYE